MKLILIITSLFALLPTHEYHVSKTNVRYVAEREQVQVEMHLFVEDLELDMAAAGAPARLEIGTKMENTDAARYIDKYLAQHFEITWNDSALPLEVVGYELDNDLHGLWVYLAANEVASPEAVKVSTSIITQTYADQRNIVKLYNGTERMATLLLSKDRTEEEWER